MTIKEVEQELGLPRASIRFYEKEKLINPTRGENAYRDYSEEDVARLKKIIILRKIGLSVSEISDFLEGNAPLQKLLEKNILDLQQKMDELNGAIKICKQMQGRQEELESFDEEFYWKEISLQEKAGNKFLDIAKDTIEYEKKIILNYFDVADEEGNLRYSKGKAFLKAMGVCVLFGGVSYFAGDREIAEFVEGFFQPFILIVIISIFGLPLHFLGKKYPRTAEIIKKTALMIFVIGLIMLLLIVIFGKRVN